MREVGSELELRQARNEAVTALRGRLPEMLQDLRTDLLESGPGMDLGMDMDRIGGVILFFQAVEEKVHVTACDCPKCTAWTHVCTLGVEMIKAVFGTDRDLTPDEVVRLHALTEFIAAALTLTEMVKALTTQRLQKRRSRSGSVALLAGLLGMLGEEPEPGTDPLAKIRKELHGNRAVTVLDFGSEPDPELGPEPEPEPGPSL